MAGSAEDLGAPVPGEDEAQGEDGAPGLLGEALATTVRLRRPLYGSALAVTALAACGVAAIAVLGFALTWDAFELLRERVRSNQEAEVPPFSATGDIDVAFTLNGMLVVFLLLLLAAAVLTLLYTAHAVAVRDAPSGRGAPPSGGLWRRARPYMLRVLATQLAIGLGVVAAVLVGAFLFDSMASGLIPGVERPGAPFTGFGAADWAVGLGLPLAAGCVGPYLVVRLSLAPSAVVFEDVRAAGALRRSWRLTGGARAGALGLWLLIAAAVAIAFTLLLVAASPLAAPAGAAVMRLSDGNRFTTATLVHYLPAAVALVLLPLAVVPPVGAALPVLYARLRASEEGRAPYPVPPPPS
ncbi:hypothetical protein [Nocardiopsis tropica]|uniref:Integral membrane protein n=1 Tax=Nocardiopsis tropica TaxID=109330 RepID=A0ABU7KZS1_9ACTN|nr:hypothetical protein [Nocardiopsis umidischolae]MEE2054494.1 hypothetical protein [Nocardiopsis umidischolae]